jgi:hypothetical protein
MQAVSSRVPVPQFSSLLREVVLRRVKAAPRFHRRLKMQTAPEIPRPSATANNWFPAKVTLLLSKQSGCKSSYFKEGRALPYEPSTVPERHPPSKRNGPGGIRTLTVTLAGNCAALTPQAHDRSLCQREANLKLISFIWRNMSFLLGTEARCRTPVTSDLVIHSPKSRSWLRP